MHNSSQNLDHRDYTNIQLYEYKWKSKTYSDTL